MFAFFLAAVNIASGHGAMQMPYIWQDRDRVGLTTGFQGQAGCQPGIAGSGYVFGPGSECSLQYFTNFTHISGKSELELRMRTYGTFTKKGNIPFFNPDFTINPWYRPGRAVLNSPCGVVGGNPKGCDGGADCPGGGYGFGKDARNVTYENVAVTDWKKGEIVEVGFGLNANHGGGYSYRLCKKQPGKPYSDYLTEECFQAGSLDLLGDTQFLQYGKDRIPRVEIEARRSRVGTYPENSQWTRNPIPACAGIDGISGPSIDDMDGLCANATDVQFKPPAPGHFYGYGVDYAHGGKPSLNFSIVDQLQVPSDLTTGDYVLSWRWDCEQTPQVWLSCADVRIVA